MQIDTLDWPTIRQHLTSGIKISSHSNPARTFEIDKIESDKLFVWPMNAARKPQARSRPVSRHDFETVLAHWNDYHSAVGFEIPTRNNSYCLGIITYVLERLQSSTEQKEKA
ncbi:MAG: hypothetical protein ACRYFU_19005 [Janthinobacterium lividum]